jgi:DNA-binding NarL/FixJ family response regulator
MRSKRILIADDHEVVRSGLRAILEAQEGWQVVAEASNGREAIKLVLQEAPDVAILDYSIPLINGIEVARNIKGRQLGTEILIFTMHDSDVLVREAFQAGARAFLVKSEAKQYLIQAVEALLAHRPYFSGLVSEKMLASFLSSSPPEILSAREKTIVQLVAEGHSNKEMSKILGLSVKTIEAHRSSAIRKLGVKSTAELVRYAIRNTLIVS